MTNLPGIIVLLFPPVLIFKPIWKKRKNEKPIDTIQKKKRRKKDRIKYYPFSFESFFLYDLTACLSFLCVLLLTPE